MKNDKHFFIFIYAKSRGEISAGGYLINYDNGGFVDAEGFTCRMDAQNCALLALEKALFMAQVMGCQNVTICADEPTLGNIKENGTKMLRRFSRVNFQEVDHNPAEKLANIAFYKRMGW